MQIRNSQHGFTLVEIVFAVSILALVLIGIATLGRDLFSLSRIVSGNLWVQTEMKRSFRLMSKELRTASPGSTGAYPIAQAATSSITFYSNIDSTSLKERVRYFLEGTTLKKGVVVATGSPLAYGGTETISELVHDVANGTTSIFSYYDETYDGTTAALPLPIDPLSVRLVKFYVRVDKDASRPPAALSLTTQVMLRNIREE